MRVAEKLTNNRWKFYNNSFDKDSILFDTEFNSWFVFNFKNFTGLLMNKNLSTKKKEVILEWPIEEYDKEELFNFYNGWLMFMQGDEHKQLKKSVNSYLNLKIKEVNFPEINLSLDHYGSVKSSISIPYVNGIMCQIMGMDKEDFKVAIEMTEKINAFLLKGVLSVEDITQCVKEIKASYLFLEQLEVKYKNIPNFVGNYIKKIPKEKRYPLLINLLSDGYAPFISSLNFLIYNCLKSPDIYKDFIKSGNIKAFVAESLRLFPSFTTISRIVINDFRYEDVLFKKGQMVIFDLVSINRDSSFYAEPDSISNENTSRTATFGVGTHVCSGASLVSLALCNFLETVGAKVLDYKIQSEQDYSSYVFLDKDFELIRRG